MSRASANAEDMCGVVHRPDAFVSQLDVKGGGLERIAKAIIAVVDHSFDTHPMRGGSKSGGPEWKSRQLFLVGVFRNLQGDLKWTTDRALSMLETALTAKLEGRPWRPIERRALYAPDQALANRGIILVDDPAFAPAGPKDGIESLAELKFDDAGE